MEDDNKTTTSIRIDKDVWLRARMKALSKGTTMGEAIETLLKEWTKEKPTGKEVLLDTDRKDRPSRRSLSSDVEEEASPKETDARFRGA